MANELANAQVTPPQTPELPSPLAEVAQGVQPAAVLPPVAPNAAMDPAQEFVVSNFEVLPKIGLDIFEAPDLTTVVFNSKLLDRPTVEAAAKAGTLQELLAPRPQPGQALAGATVAQSRAAERPQMEVQSAPAAPALPAPKVPASTQNLLAKARVRNLGAGPKPPGITPDPISSRVSKRPV
jgi:hypothetical protein